MKVLFLAENPNLFIEYATRLEENNIPFWTASNLNDFHYIVSQMTIDVVFIDYNIINFSIFDVHTHLKDKGGDLIPFFLNKPSDIKSLFVQWEDSVLKNYPNKWTGDLESLLRIVANQPLEEFAPFRASRVQDLVEQIEGEQKLYEKKSKETFSFPITESPDKKQDLKGEIPHSKNKENLVATELIEDFYKIKQLQKLSFSEFLILDLLKKRKTDFVTIHDMIQFLNMSHEEKSVKKIYKYIHNIRRYLEKQKTEQWNLIRIKKSVYTLISSENG